MTTKKCIRCGKVREIKAKGLCNSCYNSIKKNQLRKKSYASKKNEYNRVNKNYVRNKIIEIIKLKGIRNILTLESSDFVFSKQIPNNKVFVFEFVNKEFERMQNKKPDNVKLFYGDVSQAKEIDNVFDCIYLDFCYSYEKASKVIYDLKEKIKQASLFGVTFCLRNYYPEEVGDYQFDIIRRISDLVNIPLKVLYGYSYREEHNKTAIMITILFENFERKNEI